MKSKSRVGSLYLSDQTWDGLEQRAVERQISKSAVAEEILYHGLAIQNPSDDGEPKRTISEPKEVDMPRSVEELREKGTLAALVIELYYDFFEFTKSTPDAMQIITICRMIAIHAESWVAIKEQEIALTFVDMECKRLSKFGVLDQRWIRARIQAMRSPLHAMVEREQTAALETLPAPEPVAALPAPMIEQDEGDWSLIDEAIKSARDLGEEVITEKDIFQAIDRKISLERIVDLLTAKGFMPERNDKGFGYYI